MALFWLSATLLLPPARITATDNKAIRSLIVTGLVAHSRFAPGCLWLSADRSATFTTTMWVIGWVHCRATYGRTAPQMTRTTSLTNADILMLRIAHLPNSCHTQNINVALLT